MACFTVEFTITTDTSYFSPSVILAKIGLGTRLLSNVTYDLIAVMGILIIFTSLFYTIAVHGFPGYVSNIKGPSACIKHQREIHGPSCCSMFTVSTGAFDLPTQSEISADMYNLGYRVMHVSINVCYVIHLRCHLQA